MYNCNLWSIIHFRINTGMKNFFMNKSNNFLKKILISLLSFFLFSYGLWGTTYIYYEGTWYSYSGTEIIDNFENIIEEIKSNTANFTETTELTKNNDSFIFASDYSTNSTNPTFYSNNNCTSYVAEGVTITVNSNVNYYTVKLYGNLLIEEGSSFTINKTEFLISNTSTITNKGTLTIQQSLENLGTITNQGTLNLSNTFTNSGILENTGIIYASTIENKETFTNTGTIALSNLNNSGNFVTSGNFSSNSNVTNRGNITIEGGSFSLNNNIDNTSGTITDLNDRLDPNKVTGGSLTNSQSFINDVKNSGNPTWIWNGNEGGDFRDSTWDVYNGASGTPDTTGVNISNIILTKNIGVNETLKFGNGEWSGLFGPSETVGREEIIIYLNGNTLTFQSGADIQMGDINGNTSGNNLLRFVGPGELVCNGSIVFKILNKDVDSIITFEGNVDVTINSITSGNRNEKDSFLVKSGTCNLTISNPDSADLQHLTIENSSSININSSATFGSVSNNGNLNLKGNENTFTNLTNNGSLNAIADSNIYISSEISNNNSASMNAEEANLHITGNTSIIGNGQESTKFNSLNSSGAYTLSFAGDIGVNTLNLNGQDIDNKLTVTTTAESNIYLPESQGIGQFLNLASTSVPNIVDSEGNIAGFTYSVKQTNASATDQTLAEEQVALMHKGWLVIDSALFIWTGEENNNPANVNNWHLKSVPSSENDYIIVPMIDESTNHYPVLNYPADFRCAALEIQTNAKFTIDTSTFTDGQAINITISQDEENQSAGWNNTGTLIINNPYDKITLNNFNYALDEGLWIYKSGQIYNGGPNNSFHWNVEVDGENVSAPGSITKIRNDFKVNEGAKITIKEGSQENPTNFSLLTSEDITLNGSVVIETNAAFNKIEGNINFSTITTDGIITAENGNITFNSTTNLGSSNILGSSSVLNRKIQAPNGNIIFSQNSQLTINKNTLFSGNTDLSNLDSITCNNNSIFFFYNSDAANQKKLITAGGFTIPNLYFAGYVSIAEDNPINVSNFHMEIPSAFTECYLTEALNASIGSVNAENVTITSSSTTDGIAGIFNLKENHTLVTSNFVMEDASNILNEGLILLDGGIFTNNNTTNTSLNFGDIQILNSAEFYGSSSFSSFTCDISEEESPEAITITFQAGQTQSVTELLSIKGKLGKLITLKSSEAGSQWSIEAPQDSATEDSAVIIKYADVSDSNSINAIYAETSNNSGNNINWHFLQTFYWNPTLDSREWKNNQNWASRDYSQEGESFTEASSYPQEEEDSVVISDGKNSYPLLSEEITIRNLSIGESEASDALLELGESNLKLTLSDSPFINYGKIIYTHNGRITNNDATAINDTENNGTVEYKATEDYPGTINSFKENSSDQNEAGYGNLLITSGNWTINSDIIAKGEILSKTDSLSISSETLISGKKITIGSDLIPTSTNFPLTIQTSGSETEDSIIFENSDNTDKTIALGNETNYFSNIVFSCSNGNPVTFNNKACIYAYSIISMDPYLFKIKNTKELTINVNSLSFMGEDLIQADAKLSIISFLEDSYASFDSGEESIFSASEDVVISIPSTFEGNNNIKKITINDKASFIGANTFQDLSINNNLTDSLKITFQAGQTQNVTNSFTVNGQEGKKVLLTTSATAPSKDDKNTWWNFNAGEGANIKIEHALIEYSNADPPLARSWPATFSENTDSSTIGWFLRGFYWYGIEDNSWNTSANWSTTKDTYTACSTSPNYVDGISEINIIQLSQDNKILKLENDINIKSLIVEEKAQMDLAAYSVITSKTITNGGTIKLEGNENQTINATTITNEEGSCIEYYASSIKLAWGENYENLSFTNEAASESPLNANVNGQLIIQNSNCEESNSLSLNVNLSENASPIQIGYKDENSAEDIVAGNVVIQSQEGSSPLSLADNILCKNLTINSPVNAGELSLYGNLTLSGNSSIEATRLSLYGNLNVDSENQITMNSEFILYGNSTGSTEFTVNKPNFTIKSFIIKTDTDIPLNINSTQTSNISENFVILSTNMNLINQGAFFIGEDLIILGEDYNIDDTYNDTQTGYNSINKYNQKRDSACNFDLDTLLNSMSWRDFSSTITAENNFTFNIGKNFYCNGATLKGTSDSSKITLSIYDTKEFNECFAEAYHSSIAYCDVTSRNDSSNPSKIPAYNCNISNSANWDNEDFTIEYIDSVSDNIIEIKFSQPLKNIKPLLNIINEGITQRPHFNNIYSDIACSTLITDDIISDPFYLKAKETWNTDANGESAGHTSSTDKSGNHKDIVLSLDIPSAIKYTNNNTSTFLIRNQYGKRLKNYSKNTPTQTEAFKDVEDKVGPVLIGVKTGQELHIEPEENILLQKSYDAHNFIEFLYSEAVKFITEDEATNNLLNTDLYAQENADKIIQNVMVKDELGAISGDISQENNLTFAGLGVIEKGLVHTGSTDATINGKYVNALYRENMHSLKISIAGLTSGSEITTENNVKYQNWIGYIEEAILPSGKITEYFTDNTNKTNSNISDFKGNQLQKNNISEENFLVDNSENNIYGDWDTQGPSFVPYRSDETAWTSALYENGFEAESIGRSIGNGSYLTHIEFHLFDNKPAFNAEDEAQWFSEIGWCKPNTNTPELLINNAAPNNLDNSYSADIFGGARPFVSKEYRTRGGIRYSSLINSSQGFKYSTDDSLPSKTFGNSIYAGASGFIFTGSSNPRRAANQKEGLHFGLSLTEQYSHKTTFTISYDQTKATITDLAGNKLKSATFKTKDRTPPSFYLTLSPVSQKEIYIIIMQKLLTESSDIKYITNDGETKELDEPYLQILPDCFEIISIDQTGQASVNPNGNLQIDYSKAAEIMPQSNDDFTVLKLYLTKDVNLADIQNLYIRVKNPAGFDVSSTDPVTNTKNAGVSFIQNRKYNYIEINTAHAISDFAINAIMPSYAYNIIEEEDLSSLTDVSSNSDQLRSITDWDRDQLLLGSLLLEKPISLFANVKRNLGENGGALEGNNISQIKMYLSNKADSNSLSNVINNNFENLNWRIWLPQITENNYTSPIFNTIALQNNSNYKEVLATSTNEDESIALAQEVSFNLNQDLLKNFKENTQLSFLFGFMDDNNQQIKIIPEPLLDFENLGHYDLDSSLKYPLLSLRLENPMDIFSLDLWSFKLLTSHSQRGGVSILNNVINPLNNEETTIKLNLSQTNNINIMVMTLDGNIITYLCKSSELSAGEHTFYWNGKNKANKAVARGLYFIRIIGKNIDETRKVMIVK